MSVGKLQRGMLRFHTRKAIKAAIKNERSVAEEAFMAGVKFARERFQYMMAHVCDGMTYNVEDSHEVPVVITDDGSVVVPGADAEPSARPSV